MAGAKRQKCKVPNESGGSASYINVVPGLAVAGEPVTVLVVEDTVGVAEAEEIVVVGPVLAVVEELTVVVSGIGFTRPEMCSSCKSHGYKITSMTMPLLNVGSAVA